MKNGRDGEGGCLISCYVNRWNYRKNLECVSNIFAFISDHWEWMIFEFPCILYLSEIYWNALEWVKNDNQMQIKQRKFGCPDNIVIPIFQIDHKCQIGQIVQIIQIVQIGQIGQIGQMGQKWSERSYTSDRPDSSDSSNSSYRPSWLDC